MMKTFDEIQKELVKATESEESWAAFKSELGKGAAADSVKVDFEVTYNELTHGIELRAEVSTLTPNTYLLQIWLQDIHTGFWIPELHPFNVSVVELEAGSRVTTALCGLVDHKWRADDSGSKYEALVWGYVEQDGTPILFGPYSETFVYP